MQSVLHRYEYIICGVLSYKTTIHFKQMMSEKYSMYFFKVHIREKTGKCRVCPIRGNRTTMTKIQVKSFVIFIMIILYTISACLYSFKKEIKVSS